MTGKLAGTTDPLFRADEGSPKWPSDVAWGGQGCFHNRKLRWVEKRSSDQTKKTVKESMGWLPVSILEGLWKASFKGTSWSSRRKVRFPFFGKKGKKMKAIGSSKNATNSKGAGVETASSCLLKVLKAETRKREGRGYENRRNCGSFGKNFI